MITKRVFTALLVGAIMYSSFAYANEQQLKAECERYAQEDGVSKEEMKDYMKDCIADLKEIAKSSGD